MTAEPAAGMAGSVQRLVDEEHCVPRSAYDVLSTPTVVLLLEQAAVAALEPVLRPDQGSVGAVVDIQHVRPTLRGQQVTATATVTEVDRRRISFFVEVADDVEVVAHGRHERFIIDDASFGPRLAAKALQAADLSGGGST